MRKIILFILLMLTAYNLIYAMTEQEKSNMQKEIKSGWMFRQAASDKWYTAEVPGCVHTDLLNNHLIDDPFLGINEQKLQWIGEKNWTYQTVFDVENELLSKQNLSLIFKGLDTYADVFLNDSLILKAENMFREWKVEAERKYSAFGIPECF